MLSVGAGNAAAQNSRPLLAADFEEQIPQGFADRQNSESMSMIWWRDRLFVGTNRANACIQQAVLAFFRPDLGSYPPTEADVECTPEPEDLPLRAEIWRWTPGTNQWDLMYRSPEDVPIPGHPGKFVARDIAFRGMAVFIEPDGTEALYVSGVTARGFNEPGLPPPRLLRSTDGEIFEPVPQDPGTFLGDLPYVGFRGIESYNGKFYILASVGDLGHGVVLESSDPAAGNDAFRLITPDGMTFFEIEVFNNFLYLGTGVQPVNDRTPFSLFKTDATGTPPYELTPVIVDGAYRKNFPGFAVISMQEFRNRLFVGTERELFRVNPDDTWDLVVGTPRKTPEGRKLAPISGFDHGFDNFFNIHMWRQGVHDGYLYVGTQDQSTRWRNNPTVGPVLLPKMGFDFFATPDGRHFTDVTRNGFTTYVDYRAAQPVHVPDNILNRGVRSIVSTPHGMFVGSANYYFGTKIWKGEIPGGPEQAVPKNLAVEGEGPSTLLSWEPSPNTFLYEVFRDEGLRAPELIGTTPDLHYFDETAKKRKTYHYYVVAVSPTGTLSGASNLVRSPFLAPKETFIRLYTTAWRLGLPSPVKTLVAQAASQAREGAFDESLANLEDLRNQAITLLPFLVGPLKAEDVVAQLDTLIRRVSLAQAGLIQPNSLILGLGSVAAPTEPTPEDSSTSPDSDNTGSTRAQPGARPTQTQRRRR